MSEPRRRKGRGIDAIFDSTDLDLGPAPPAPEEPRRAANAAAPEEPPREKAPRQDARTVRDPETDLRTTVGAYRDHGAADGAEGGRRREGGLLEVRQPERRDQAGDGGGGLYPVVDGEGAPIPRPGQAYDRPHAPSSGRSPTRSPGRPPSNRPAGRELVQRGFYLEIEQDRTLDETKAALKRRGFTPDRSAIVRAALEHFGRLDRAEQGALVRQEK